MSSLSGPLRFEPAQLGDAVEMAKLYAASRKTLTFLPNLHTHEEDIAFFSTQIIPHMQVTLVWDDARLLGFMAQDKDWVEQLYVAPDCLRAGIGSQLMARAKAQSDHLHLWCFEDNFRARAFYERHGFRVVERTDGSGNEEKCPDLRLEWRR